MGYRFIQGRSFQMGGGLVNDCRRSMYFFCQGTPFFKMSLNGGGISSKLTHPHHLPLSLSLTKERCGLVLYIFPPGLA